MSEETKPIQNEIDNPTSPLLNTRELAERWGVCENVIRRLVWRSELLCTRIGRSIRFALGDINRYEREHTGLHSDGYQLVARS